MDNKSITNKQTSNPRPDTDHSYFRQGMVGKKRWNSYYYQLKFVMQFQPTSVLEIGLGNGVVSNYLQKRVRNYYSLDIDRETLPSVFASVTNIPFRNSLFDVVLVAEVLEHLPFEEFPISLAELHRVSANTVVLSLPQTGIEIGFSFIFPFLGNVSLGTKFSSHRKRDFDGLHYWEINRGSYPLKRIREAILDSGFLIDREIHSYDTLYNRFFLLRKR